MANIFTGSRIILSIILLFLPPLTSSFYTVYILCGLTDMIDGTVARKTDSANLFGAQFDSLADFIFISVCFIKLLPILHFHPIRLICIVLIFIIKILNMLVNRKIFSSHTILNKITGLLLFLFPFTMNTAYAGVLSLIICIIALSAALQEFIKNKM